MAFDVQSLIYDRTSADVASGVRKGGYDYTDMLRVQAAVQDIQRTLEQYGYQIRLALMPSWTEDSRPYPAEFDDYIANVRTLRDTLGLTNQLPSTMRNLTFSGANALEQCLADLEDMLRRIRLTWSRAGQIYAGGITL